MRRLEGATNSSENGAMENAETRNEVSDEEYNYAANEK